MQASRCIVDYGLLRHPVESMAHPVGNHHFDYCLGKARFAGCSAGGEGKAAI